MTEKKKVYVQKDTKTNDQSIVMNLSYLLYFQMFSDLDRNHVSNTLDMILILTCRASISYISCISLSTEDLTMNVINFILANIISFSFRELKKNIIF